MLRDDKHPHFPMDSFWVSKLHFFVQISDQRLVPQKLELKNTTRPFLHVSQNEWLSTFTFCFHYLEFGSADGKTASTRNRPRFLEPANSTINRSIGTST